MISLVNVNVQFSYYLVVFYGCITAIILLILDIIYVSYSFSKKKFTVLWPLFILRNVASLFVTVLFLRNSNIFIYLYFNNFLYNTCSDHR
jgi:hypothetical protein